MSWDLQAELRGLDEAHLRRRLRVTSPQSDLLNFSSNDYLGLSQHEGVKAALVEGAVHYGAGSGASRLVTGTHGPHEALEQALADFKQTEAALTFGSGYAAALGAITALIGAADTVILDKLSHASLIDAARLSGAKLRVFPHNHIGRLESLLRHCTAASRRVLVVTESVFSMDGDTAPLAEIVALKERYGAWLLVDEAHAIGVLGPQGRGVAAELGVAERVDIHLGTLSKAVGLAGGYIAAKREVIDLLINRARSFIYTTAPPPMMAHAALTALRILSGEEGDILRERLHGHIRTLRSGLGAALDAPLTAIHPHIVGDEALALALADKLREHGFVIPAIRYPTVPRGSARLRITLSACHERRHVELLSRLLAETSCDVAG